MTHPVTIRRPVARGEITIKRTVAAPKGKARARSFWRVRVFVKRLLGLAEAEARVWSAAEMARISEMMRVG